MENLKYLLSDPKARDEIEKHKWYESEKSGYDIGYEAAAQSWLNLYGAEWAKNNLQSGVSAPLAVEVASPKIKRTKKNSVKAESQKPSLAV